MPKSPLISILLPFQNEARYIEQCINSIIDQDYPNWELIAVDDHSTDDSPTLVNSFASGDSRIKYVVNSGEGVISALQTAFRKSRGTLLTRMDGDDYKAPNNLSSMLKVLASGCIAIGKVSYFRIDGLGDGYRFYENWINEVNETGRTWKEVYRECVIPSPCWLVSREDLIRSGGFESSLYPEDYDLCFRFYKAELKPVCTRDVIHFWRDHDTRTTRVSPLYSDNHFTYLKVHYFLDIEHNQEKELVIVGAGGKAKKVARLLLSRGESFTWITNNSKKIGHEIYGIILESSDGFKPGAEHQVIIAMAFKVTETTESWLIEDSPNVWKFF